MKNLCSKCPKRDTCTELCSEALAYVDQDYVGIQQAFKISAARKWQFRVPVKPEDKAKAIEILHRQGYSDEDISIHLETSIEFIRDILDEDL